MVKVGLMKKLLVLSLVFACMTGNAQIPADSVVMTVAGKQIPLDEFVFIAQKNSEVNLSDRKSVDAYVELFKNFKLKVAEAEDLGLDKTKAFKDELDGYRAQLTSSYLSDKDSEEAAVRAVYDRYGEVLELSHILFRLPQRTLSKDTVPVYQKAIEAYKRIQAGEDFAAVGEELKEADKEHTVTSFNALSDFLDRPVVKCSHPFVGQPKLCSQSLEIFFLQRSSQKYLAFPFIEFLQRLQKRSILNDIHKR